MVDVLVEGRTNDALDVWIGEDCRHIYLNIIVM